jgi:hypothetical protein
LNGYTEAGILDGKHDGFYRRYYQMIELKDRIPPSVGEEGPLYLAIDCDRQ